MDVFALPHEVLVYLWSFLSAEDFCVVSTVCKSWCEFVSNENLWKIVCHRNFFVDSIVDKETWKGTYKTRFLQAKQIASIVWAPEHLNEETRKSISLHSNGLTIECVGSQTEPVGAIQASQPLQTFPIGDQCIVAYFEAFIDDEGNEGSRIGLGIGLKDFPLSRIMPGWRKGSYGFHGDDGRLYNGTGWGLQWGPTFGLGDTVGCGVNFYTKELFFTKNGKFLGVAIKNLKYCRSYFPIMGLHSHKARATANFGSHPFVFDIASYVTQFDVPTQWLEDEESAPTIDWVCSSVLLRALEYLEGLNEIMNEANAENNEEFVQYIRQTMTNIYGGAAEFDHVDAAELFRQMRFMTAVIKRRQREEEFWNVLPSNLHPQLNFDEYVAYLRDLAALSAPHPSNHPTVYAVIQQYRVLFETYLNNPDDHPLDVKRRFLIASLQRQISLYILASHKRDIFVLANTSLPANHALVREIVERYATVDRVDGRALERAVDRDIFLRTATLNSLLSQYRRITNQSSVPESCSCTIL